MGASDTVRHYADDAIDISYTCPRTRGPYKRSGDQDNLGAVPPSQLGGTNPYAPKNTQAFDKEWRIR